jgi:hypothetical protein
VKFFFLPRVHELPRSQPWTTFGVFDRVSCTVTRWFPWARYLGATGSNTSLSIFVLMGAGVVMGLLNFASFLVLRTFHALSAAQHQCFLGCLFTMNNSRTSGAWRR